jgi:AP-1 complex subunit mu
MSYRLSTPVKPLIWVEAAVESHKGSRVEYLVKCKAQFKRRSTANNVEIYVPVPDDADSPKFRVCFLRPIASLVALFNSSIGIHWHGTIRTRQVGLCLEDQTTRRRSRIPHESPFWSTQRQKWYESISHGTDLVLTHDSIEQEGERRPPITVKFEIPYFTVSGIQVRYLKIVEKSGYQALPWVRYITQNGDDYRQVSIWPLVLVYLLTPRT